MAAQNTTRRNTWFEHVQAWKQSHLSQKAYSEQHNLKAHQLSYWYRKFEKTHVSKITEVAHENFIPVTLSEASATTTNGSPVDLTLQLPKGICLTGIQMSNMNVVQALVKVLL